MEKSANMESCCRLHFIFDFYQWHQSQADDVNDIIKSASAAQFFILTALKNLMVSSLIALCMTIVCTFREFK